jgi:hypothetical protein
MMTALSDLESKALDDGFFAARVLPDGVFEVSGLFRNLLVAIGSELVFKIES